MGNASTIVQNVRCFDPNLSRTSVTEELWDIHGISDTYTSNSIATAVVILILFMIGFPSNIIIIASILHQKLYKESMHILLLNLAISDLLVCLFMMPPMIVTGFSGGFIFGDSDYIRCQFCQGAIIFVALTVFALNILAAITLDRFIFIKFPMHHNRYVTTPKILAIVLFLWIFSIVESLPPVLGFGSITFAFSISSCTVSFFGQGKYSMNIYYVMLLVFLALVPLVIIIIFNVWVACIVGKQIKVVYRTRRSFGNREELKKYNEGLRKKIHKKKNRKQLVLVRAFSAILISTIVSWAPLMIHSLVALAIDDSNSIPLGIYSFVFISFIMHSVLHSLIEGLFIPEIKMTYKKVLGYFFLQRLYVKFFKRRRKKMSIVSTAPLNPSLGDVEPSGSCCVSLQNCCEFCGFAVISEIHDEEKEITPMETHDSMPVETHEMETHEMETHDITPT